MCRKSSQYKKACISGLKQDWDVYLETKRYARSLLIRKKRDYITRQLHENKSAPKKFWKEIQNNLSFGKCKNESKEITIYSPNKTLLNGEVATNEMNLYYSKVGKKLAEKFTDSWNPVYVCVLPCPPEMHFRFVGEKEVISLI